MVPVDNETFLDGGSGWKLVHVARAGPARRPVATETLSDGQRGASGLLFGIDRDVP